ncbi:hypothetical protein M5689_018713 [Euphorbia peplus]|nr:hypothetical protein M5689_018713 [Euphorbia peplus]
MAGGKKDSKKKASTGGTSSRSRQPFNFRSDEEKSRFALINGVVISTYMLYISWPTALALSIKRIVKGYVETLGWTKFVDLRFTHTKHDIAEFWSTLSFANPGKDRFQFRNANVEYEFGREELHDWFGFPLTGVTMPPDFDHESVWNALTGLDKFHTSNSPNVLLKDDSLLYFHKYLSLSLFGRAEMSKIHKLDLFVLHCIVNKTQIDSIEIIFGTFRRLISLKKVHALPFVNFMGGIIQAAKGTLMDYQKDLTKDDIECSNLDLWVLHRCRLIDTRNEWLPYSKRTAKFFHKPLGASSSGASKGKKTLDIEIENDDDDGDSSDEDEVTGWRKVLGCLKKNNRRLEGKLDSLIQENASTTSIIENMADDIKAIRA